MENLLKGGVFFESQKQINGRTDALLGPLFFDEKKIVQMSGPS